MAKKYYVVWEGREPGIYDNWAECEAQVKGVAGALYKSFKSLAEAEQAYDGLPADHMASSSAPSAPDSSAAQVPAKAPHHQATRSADGLPPNPPADRHDTVLPLPPQVTANALAVDAACSGNPGPMEYRGVYLATGQTVFHYGPVHGTNNIGEFLAIVHGLALLKQRGLNDMPIYSDSVNAQLWVRRKKCKTTLTRNAKTEQLYQLIERAENWLANNAYSNPIIKWPTEQWGEIPADFGRK